MSLITRKDIGLLLEAGFSEEDLGLVEGGFQGVEVYDTPDDYFAHEIIENACEAGEVDLYDELLPPAEETTKIPYDTSHKSIYADQEYAGNDDMLDGVPPHLYDQVNWLKTVKLGKLTIWQRRNPKTGTYEMPVKSLNVKIGDEDKERYSKMSREDQKTLWIAYARDEWKHLWEFTASALHCSLIEEKIEFKTKSGNELNLLVVSADHVRKEGYQNLPPEARWITMIYWYKDRNP
jgi:hypothetical protein